MKMKVRNLEDGMEFEVEGDPVELHEFASLYTKHQKLLENAKALQVSLKERLDRDTGNMNPGSVLREEALEAVKRVIQNEHHNTGEPQIGGGFGDAPKVIAEHPPHWEDPNPHEKGLTRPQVAVRPKVVTEQVEGKTIGDLMKGLEKASDQMVREPEANADTVGGE